MIRYGAQRVRPNQGLGASGLRDPEPKCKSIYLSINQSIYLSIYLWRTNNSNILLLFVRHKSWYSKNPTNAIVCRYLFTAKLLYMFRVSQHPSSEVLKTVPTASGTGHNTGAATSLQRVLIGTASRSDHVGGE